VLGDPGLPPLRQRIRGECGPGGLGATANGCFAGAFQADGRSIGLRLCSAAVPIGVLCRSCRDRAFPGKKFACWVWPASIWVQRGHGAERGKLWRPTPEESGILAAAWLVLSELGCPLRWLQNSPEALEAWRQPRGQ